MTKTMPALRLAPELRDRLRAIADELIPAADGMPAASEVGVADAQLDEVLSARPDLAEPLAAALARPAASTAEWLSQLEAEDRTGYDAVLLAIVGGYYTDRDVRRRLGYRGQEPMPVRPDLIPEYAEDGSLEAVLERGPVYRAVPADPPQPTTKVGGA